MDLKGPASKGNREKRRKEKREGRGNAREKREKGKRGRSTPLFRPELKFWLWPSLRLKLWCHATVASPILLKLH